MATKEQQESARRAAVTYGGTMKPATPLPWIANGDEDHDFIIGGNPQEILADCSIGRVRPIEDKTNAAYIVAAANAYPRLVQALKALVEAEEIYGDQESVALNAVWLPAAALLRDLGEL